MRTVVKQLPSPGLHSPPAASVGVFLWASALAAVFLLITSICYVGFQASDDINYVNGAFGWIEHFPFVGNSHWTLRHTINLPTATLINLFGLNEISVSLTNVLYFAAFLVTNAVFMSRFVNPVSAWIATLLLVTMPGFVVVATYLNPDIPELFYTTLAFWVFFTAVSEQARPGLWLLAGGLAGIAFVNRQTSAAFVLFLAALFLFKPTVGRSRYFLMAGAFAAVVGAEWLYLFTMTGDPLYRLKVDFNHDPVNRTAEVARVLAQGRWIDKEGNLSVNVYADPALALFVSQKYVAVFWLAIPGAISLARSADRQARLVLGLVGLLAATSFLFVAANPKLYLVPRYLTIAAWGACVVASWWLARLWSAGKAWQAGLILASAVAANLASLALENTNPRIVERTLVRWVAQHPDTPVYTDIETQARSEYFFRFAGLSMDTVSSVRPPAGARFFYNAQRVAQCAASPRCRDRASEFSPRPGWTLEEKVDVPRGPVAGVLLRLGFDRVVPREIAQRVLAPAGEILIYRVRQD